MPPRQDDDTGSLEKARKRLYSSETDFDIRRPLAETGPGAVPHAWKSASLDDIPHPGGRHVRFAGVFFIIAFVFFVISLGVAGYFFYFGGNSVSVDKIAIDILGPTTIAAGDTVPLSLTVTNRNPVSIENATIEITFPNGTKSADGSLGAYPRYIENIGELASGATATRSIRAIIFGGAGQALVLPTSFSFETKGSTTVFVKKTSYALAVSSTPLSVSVDTAAETVSGKLITFTLNVRSNATVPLDNVVLLGVFPFGFAVADSSLPMTGSSIALGRLEPGENKTITLTGTLTGQDTEQRVFHFTVGTSKSASDNTVAVAYMTQDATVTIVAPFITASISLNGDASSAAVVAPDSFQNVTVSYANTLSTSITNATVSVKLSGSAVDYGSIRTASGFYDSANREVIFNRDTDPSLATLTPGSFGIGTFSFSTMPSGATVSSPMITFTVSVSGTRVGQTNVPEKVNASVIKTVKVATAVALSASSLHFSGPLSNSGPIPPRAGNATTYTIVWNVKNSGSTVAGSSVSATLPSYVSYTDVTAGAGSFSYDSSSRTVAWNIGDIVQGASVQGSFQVSLTPSTSQVGSAPILTGAPSFSGHDRFAGVQIQASANPSTTETPQDPGYTSERATVR
ncbi:hypothetical protein HYT04_02360 [Candidatus Kaiserbacteria bacterium]|nr:hypothetical protein [Candidatus Kaiserbacteria bacterium]